MTASWLVVLVAASYGCVAFVGLRLAASVCEKIVPFSDGPRPGTPPSRALLAGAIVVGALLAARGIPTLELAVFAILIVSLVSCWYSDVRCGIVPDSFTLVPLALVLGFALANHDVMPVVSALVVGLPFAGAALLSGGRGVGWGDVKLVALGGACLGLQSAVLAFSVACFVAVAIAFMRRRQNEPVAFVPYLAGSMAVAVSLPGLR